jgi:hypothetical protein
LAKFKAKGGKAKFLERAFLGVGHHPLLGNSVAAQESPVFLHYFVNPDNMSNMVL